VLDLAGLDEHQEVHDEVIATARRLNIVYTQTEDGSQRTHKVRSPVSPSGTTGLMHCYSVGRRQSLP
jgi:hypothetical protein